ncbi:MAG TPA: NAD-dependent epimerase/dehydratase family protein [Mycobacterium sp.]|nr:NAD-dependent epimerase/dehydratase family protein [Mycobacterium sp.]HUH72199.1 NAD-dependent epimerase/dehydratase family protein [Mycobacterium sp.]
MPSTAYVTGAAGFVGRHLTERLVAEGWQVTALCRPADRIDVLPPEVEVKLGDLTDPHSVMDTLKSDTDAVFHLAANTSTWSRNRGAQFRDNVGGTAAVIDAVLARGAKRLIYTSSISSFGYQPGVVINEHTPSNAPRRGDNYGKSKLAAERLIQDACAQRGLSAVILNPVNILGAYDASNWSKQLILPIAEGKLRLVPPGSASWVWVHDVVSAHLAAVTAGGIGERIILGGVRASFKEVVNTIEDLLGKPPTTRVTPKPLLALLCVVSIAAAAVSGREPQLSVAKYRRAVGDLKVDDQLAREELGLVHTPLKQQLADTITWLSKAGLVTSGIVERA